MKYRSQLVTWSHEHDSVIQMHRF